MREQAALQEGSQPVKMGVFRGAGSPPGKPARWARMLRTVRGEWYG
jgi:hypothetical protein